MRLYYYNRLNKEKSQDHNCSYTSTSIEAIYGEYENQSHDNMQFVQMYICAVDLYINWLIIDWGNQFKTAVIP